MVIRDRTTEVLPSGLGIQQPPEMNKRRERRYYYRRITVQGGEMVWVRTELLPADVQSRAYYLAKGFRLDPPEGSEWSLPNTAKDEAKAKTDAEKDSLLQKQQEIISKQEEKINSFEAEIAALRQEFASMKGKQEQLGKVGKRRRTRRLNT